MIAVFDIDGTIANTPPVPNGTDFAAWCDLILTGTHPPIPRALEGVERTIHGASRVLVLTARSERLRKATERWLQQHIPPLAGRAISMRALDDLRPSVLSKWDRLHGLRDRPMMLIDDDPAMAVCCGTGDVFRLAPGCWE